MASDDGAATAPAPAATDEASRDWLRTIGGDKGLIVFMGSGDRAALRRIPLTRSREADGVVVKLLTKARVPEGSVRGDFDRWRLIAHVAALLSGTGARQAHDRRRPLGRALHDARYSENRLLRLLGTRGTALEDQVHRAARMLAVKGQPADLWQLYHLIGHDPDKAEAARIRIAQDFYAAEARSEEGVSRDD